MADLVMRSELTLFDGVALDSSLTDQHFVDHLPISQIPDNATSITFDIKANEGQYIDLSATSITLKTQLANVGSDTGVDNTKLLVAPANLLCASLFQDVQLFLNNTLVEGGSYAYAYKSYICALLEHDPKSHKQLMETWGFRRDQTGLSVASSNFNFTACAKKLGGNKTWTVRGPLFLDMMRQTRFLLPKVDVRIVLHLSTPKWLLMQAPAAETDTALLDAPRLKVLSAHLTMRHVTLNESIRKAHEVGLRANHPALYPLRMIVPFTHNIPNGGQYYNIENAFQGACPSLLLMGFVKDSAYNGSYTENPFKFLNPSLTSLGVFVDGCSVPRQPLKFEDGKIGNVEYGLFLEQLGIGWGGIHQIGFNSDVYDYGFTLFAFNLNANLASNGAQVPRSGNVRIELRFKVYITFGRFDRQLSIHDGGDIRPASICEMESRKRHLE
jgi:hypothetical protein